MISRAGIGVDDLAWIQRDQFVHYVTLARASHDDPRDWPAFRHALLDALTAAFGLDHEPDAERVPLMAAADVLERTRLACDPHDAWPDFMNTLWRSRHAIRPDLC